MKYISANILEKGYNPEDLSNFVIKKIGKPIESITLEQLKKLIEQFKDQSLAETYKTLDAHQEEDYQKEEPKEEIEESNSSLNEHIKSLNEGRAQNFKKSKDIIYVSTSTQLNQNENIINSANINLLNHKREKDELNKKMG